MARRYEVYLRVGKKKVFHEKINFISSSQRVIFCLLHRYECFENKKNGRKTKEDVSDIFTSEDMSNISLVSYLVCSFVWKIRVVYFLVKHSFYVNKYN